MPKIVDHARRRDEIALVACRVVAEHGFDGASMVRIARAAGYTTGMLAHYFDSKQEIIVTALRLILHRIDERLSRRPAAKTPRPDLLDLLLEALPLDTHRHVECAFWISFWGQVSADKRLKRINVWVHHEYLRLFERCLAGSWAEWPQWPAATREQVLRSLVTFINGLTASAVANRGDWPPQKQIGQLRLQLQLLRAWALGASGAPGAQQAAGAWRARCAAAPPATSLE